MGSQCSSCIPNDHHEISYFQDELYIRVATLNYGGILNSPFQFYSDQQISETALSDSFARLLPLYFEDYDPKKFDWDIGKIDQKLQEERYTPIYSEMVGVDRSSKKQLLVTARRFQSLWVEHYQTATQNHKIEPQPTKAQQQSMTLFDMICYHAIIDHVYGLKSDKQLTEMDDTLRQLDPSAYQDFMHKKFSKSYLNEQKKTQKVLQSLKHIDVALLQEPSKLMMQKLAKDSQFYIKESGVGGSMIVIKKQRFSENDQFTVKIFAQLNIGAKYFDFNGNTDGIGIAVGKYIFVSGHLSSKQSKNAGEVKALKEILSKMRNDFPGFEVIVGVDANSYVDSEGLKGYEVYPGVKSQITTSKKRTYLQPQFKKVNKQVKECKDHIITSCKIERSEVRMIDLREVRGDELLPTDGHPFDHFMVVAEIRK